MRQSVQLQKGWKFAKLPGYSMEQLQVQEDIWKEWEWENKEWEIVSIPHTWYQDEDYYQGLAIYKNTIQISFQSPAACIEFEGVDRWCKVYINGIPAGEHKGGYSTFRIPLKETFLTEENIELMVFVDNRDYGMISPLFGDFTVYGGIYRPVSLLAASQNHFDFMYYGTKGILLHAEAKANGEGILTVEPHVVIQTEESCIRILYEIWDSHGKLVAEESGEVSEEKKIVVDQAELWDGKNAAVLYRLKATLFCEDKAEDLVEMNFGFRMVSIDAKKGFSLNGKKVRIQGVAKHQDRAEVFHATSEAEQEQDMDLIQEIGANAVRLSHYQHPQHVYDLCDQAGLIVWAEIPMLKMTKKQELFEDACNQLKELILQNLHHPSICFWGIQNEIAMFRDEQYMHENCRRLYDLAVSLDHTRLVTCANLHEVDFDSPLNQITHMVGYNVYFGWYYGEMRDYGTYLDKFHEVMPEVCLGISEYGVDCNLRFHSDEPKVKDYSEEYQALYHEIVYPILESKPYLWGSFIWNMFDFGSANREEGGEKYKNCKGLVTFDRKIRKDSFYYYKSRWSKVPFVHIAEKRFKKRTGESIRVKVYSNCDEVYLYVAGNEVISKQSDGTGIFVFEQILLKKGENLVRAVCDQQEDEVVFIRCEEAEPSYQYEDDSVGEAVKNWFLKQVENVDNEYYSLQDTADMVAKSEKAMKVVRQYMPYTAERIQQDGGGLTLAQIIRFEGRKYKDLDPEEFNRMLKQIRKE